MLVPSVAPATTTAPSETVLLTQPEVIDRKKYQDQAEISCSFKAKIDKAHQKNLSSPIGDFWFIWMANGRQTHRKQVVKIKKLLFELLIFLNKAGVFDFWYILV